MYKTALQNQYSVRIRSESNLIIFCKTFKNKNVYVPNKYLYFMCFYYRIIELSVDSYI